MASKVFEKLKKGRRLSQTQFIAYGFLAIIITGTILLMTPWASRSGQSAPFLNCLFTATSASCVTGLVAYDTWTQWTLFGQLVILCMIQIGGLGFITIGVFLSIVLRRKIGLKERGLMQESVNALQISGVVSLAKRIVVGTAFFEGIGAVLLSLCFIPELGVLKGIYYGIFHSISAFCNAGFDLMGYQESFVSLVNYYDHVLVNAVIMSLITIGGIGFIVWEDISRNGLHFKKYMLHTKIVLVMSAALTFGGALLFYLAERNHLMADMSLKGKLLTSLFASVTARTAGFNTLDTGNMTDGSMLLNMILMFVGGSPGSTAGGVKTTTLMVMLLCVRSNIFKSSGMNLFGRRLMEDAVKPAATIISINMTLAVGAALAIMMIQPLPGMAVMFETFSAIGTVGMTTGITRSFLPASKMIVILLMYCGRIGSLSFALAFMQQKKQVHLMQPAERITIG